VAAAASAQRKSGQFVILSAEKHPSAVSPKSLYGSRRPGTHLAAFSSVDIRPGIPPSSALRCTHLNDANRKGT
jgi:hypothetical protein